MKKMTNKEFKEIYCKANGIDENDFNYEIILSMLSSHLHNLANDNKNNCLYDCFMGKSNRIYEELDKRGYYDDLKVAD